MVVSARKDWSRWLKAKLRSPGVSRWPAGGVGTAERVKLKRQRVPGVKAGPVVRVKVMVPLPVPVTVQPAMGLPLASEIVAAEAAQPAGKVATMEVSMEVALPLSAVTTIGPVSPVEKAFGLALMAKVSIVPELLFA